MYTLFNIDNIYILVQHGWLVGGKMVGNKRGIHILIIRVVEFSFVFMSREIVRHLVWLGSVRQQLSL